MAEVLVYVVASKYFLVHKALWLQLVLGAPT